MHRTLTLSLIIALGLWLLVSWQRGGTAPQPPEPGPVDVELEDLRPGLVASFRSLVDKEAALTRIEAKPAFNLGHGSIHPRLPAGPFEARYTGLLFFREATPVRFDAFVCGELSVKIDGVEVLSGKGDSDTSNIEGKLGLEREPGIYRFEVAYRSLPGKPARLQIWWQGPNFSREPLPAWQLKHVANQLTADFKRDEATEQGRVQAALFGCARCHQGSLPGGLEPPRGPSLADARQRLDRDWLVHWLADPAKIKSDAHMPALFAGDRAGFLERWLIAEHLTGGDARPESKSVGDHRAGRLAFLTIGCIACHQAPDIPANEQPDLGRFRYSGLKDRFTEGELAAFLLQPHARYVDGRMPRLPLAAKQAADIAAYLLLWSGPSKRDADKPPTQAEIDALMKERRARNREALAASLLDSKRCAVCHPGLGPSQPADIVIKDAKAGCLAGATGPRFTLDDKTRNALIAYTTSAARDRHASGFEERRRLVERLNCLRCHQRDSDRPPILEQAGSRIGGAYLQHLPFQRTPRLTDLLQKYNHASVMAAVREGVSGIRHERYSYRMGAFGDFAEPVVRSLAETDGELLEGPTSIDRPAADPTLGSLAGAQLIGFQGYSCVSCHIWDGKSLSQADPGAIGPELTRVPGRIRRDWFDRFLEDPGRIHPGTPMPGVTPKGKPPMLPNVLEGNAQKQKDALWAFLTLGKKAPSPKPPPPLPAIAPGKGEDALVAQIPLKLPDGKTTIESVSVLTADHYLIVYDVGAAKLANVFASAQILREVRGRLRTFAADGVPVDITDLDANDVKSPARELLGYDRLPDGVLLKWKSDGPGRLTESLRVIEDNGQRVLVRAWQDNGKETSRKLPLPASKAPAAIERTVLPDPGAVEGVLEQPGFKVVAYPRPKTVAGDDLVMPSAVAVDPETGKVFIASMKLGELFALDDPTDDGKQARFRNYGHGLFQEAYSMLAEPGALYVLHRRNLTRVLDTNKDGQADRFERVYKLDHGVAETYDYGYGLVRDRTGAFVLSLAPYANQGLPGSGGALRVVPGKPPEEIAFGFRNPVGWCTGPEGEVFYTDNQGEWVATNKLCHITKGRFYGFPNPAQREHAKKPLAQTTLWVPYGWARSINGVTYEHTGKFGPFGGQFFLAELMYGGAIIRADLEKVNGEYQGACFPFWGKGLLGPVTLAFDPKGRLFVGSITEPGWMAQPDRGALFRIDYTGRMPFEMQTIRVRPQGFRIVFTKPVDEKSARALSSYEVEHYRYEYTGAYGSPELDRARLKIERVELSADGKSAELFTAPLTTGRVYLIRPAGVRARDGDKLVHPEGAYTLNELPKQ